MREVTLLLLPTFSSHFGASPRRTCWVGVSMTKRHWPELIGIGSEAMVEHKSDGGLRTAPRRTEERNVDGRIDSVAG
jgi:hypothetical protein